MYLRFIFSPLLIQGYFLLSLSVDEEDSSGHLLEQLSSVFSSFLLIPSFQSPEPASRVRQKFLRDKFLNLLLLYYESVLLSAPFLDVDL